MKTIKAKNPINQFKDISDEERNRIFEKVLYALYNKPNPKPVVKRVNLLNNKLFLMLLVMLPVIVVCINEC